MFNPNGTFKWSINIATDIYSSDPKADTTWSYIYPHICNYFEEKGISCSYTTISDTKKAIKAGEIEISISELFGTISVSFRIVTPLAKQILNEAYDNKTIWGLPVAMTVMMDGFSPLATIQFMSRETWQSLNTPEARESERRMDLLSGLLNLCGFNDVDD